jgi:hypothetical protein
MNPPELIECLGRMQGKYLHPARSVDDMKAGIPYIWVRRDPISSRWKVDGGGHAGHDNEGRMPFVCHVLENYVLPNLSADANVAGYYNFELHDSYTYLPRDPSIYDNVMTFSKFRDHTRAICVPDMYQLAGYGGGLLGDSKAFTDKIHKVVGAYTTTGDRDPVKNERIQTCIWSLDHQDVCNLKITKIAQMTPMDIQSRYPQNVLTSLLASYVSPQEQLQHKYILNIKGNTETWDQAWMLNSNSLMLKKYHRDVCWYAPAMLDGSHFVRVYDNKQILDKVTYYTNNPREAQHITRNANRFVKEFMFPPMHAMLYWISLLEESAALNR